MTTRAPQDGWKDGDEEEGRKRANACHKIIQLICTNVKYSTGKFNV